MMAPALAALLLMTALAAQAVSDPMNSAECTRARQELELELLGRASSQQESAARLEKVRRQARLACLGPSSGTPRRSGAPQPAQRSSPPPATALAPAPALVPASPSPAVVLPSPAPAIPRAVTIGNCDPAGCWDSEGRRLNQMGPLLMGPSGLCSIQGGAVVCPR